jgi:hypothetical protein
MLDSYACSHGIKVKIQRITITALYDPIVSGTSVDSTLQVCLSTMLVLPIIGN